MNLKKSLIIGISFCVPVSVSIYPNTRSNYSAEYKTDKLNKSETAQVDINDNATKDIEYAPIITFPASSKDSVNKALSLIHLVRINKFKNDIRQDKHIHLTQQGENLLLVSNLTEQGLQKKFFRQFSGSSVLLPDTNLVIPVSIGKNSYTLHGYKRHVTNTENFDSSPILKEVSISLLGEIQPDINIYSNKFNLLGKNIQSPLTENAETFYHFELTDSIFNGQRKEYVVTFRSRNNTSPAFNGEITIDSATYAITSFTAEIPKQTGSIYHLNLKQTFLQDNQQRWVPDFQDFKAEMSYNLTTDSLKKQPLILIRQTLTNSAVPDNTFAGFSEKEALLAQKNNILNNTPLVELGSRVADAIITGYIPVGIFDLGKIQTIARLTDIEGLRFTLPLQTNESFNKYFSIGGHIGYGLKNKEWKYKTLAEVIVPTQNRTVLSFQYLNDYRRVDYNYNDYIVRENPLATGDIDIGGSIFAFHSVGYMNLRHETEVSLAHDWNPDIESTLYYRNNNLYSTDILSFTRNYITYDKINQQTITFATRFSVGQRVYDHYTHRVHIGNSNPVIYAILEAGKFHFGANNGNFGKVSTYVRQHVDFGFGHWDYLISGGVIFGSVPYTLLEIPYGRETSGYNMYQFSLLNFMEYATDKYISMHNEITLNGVVMNKIPLIKKLNLREMITFKTFYGTLDAKHYLTLDIPASVDRMTKPYSEIGVGFSNIFHLFTLQSVWRLTDREKNGVSPWGIKGSVRITF